MPCKDCISILSGHGHILHHSQIHIHALQIAGNLIQGLVQGHFLFHLHAHHVHIVHIVCIEHLERDIASQHSHASIRHELQVSALGSADLHVHIHVGVNGNAFHGHGHLHIRLGIHAV